jgi:hypothetical protein
MTLTLAEGAQLGTLEMDSNSTEDLALMARVGQAWADAIAENFARPHFPYVEAAQAYTPPASPVIEPHPPLQEYVQGLVGGQVFLRRNKKARPR